MKQQQKQRPTSMPRGMLLLLQTMLRAMLTSGWKVRASCGLPLGLERCCVICMMSVVMAGLHQEHCTL
jgi:hypothetical protein